MRRMRIIILSICLIITGCMSQGRIITLTQIKHSFEKHGVSMSEESDSESVFSRTYNDVTPKCFVIDENQKISIYVYASSKEVKKGIKDFENKTAAADVTAHTIYQIANILIFYVADESFKDKRVDLAVEELLSLTK